MTGQQEYPDTQSYKNEEEIRKRLCFLVERRKSTPIRKRDMRLKFGQLTLEWLLLQMKLRLVCGIEGEIKKRRLRDVGKDRERESKLLIQELSRHSNNKHLIRFVRRYKSCH